MNQDNINNIQNAIDYLRSAKTDKNKELITYAIDYINKAIHGIENEVVEKEYVENEVPYISTYYIKPIVKPDEDVIIDYYITDWNRKDIVNNNFSETFTVTVRVEDRDEIKIPFLKAGNHSVNIGSFNDLDNEEVHFSIQCTDAYGRNSHELFNFFLVRNEKEIKEYIMTEEDLITYNISNDDDREILKCIKVNSSATSGDMASALSEAYKNEVVPSGKYVVFIADKNDDGIPDNGYKTNLIKYADDYDKEAVLQQAINTTEGIQKLLDDKHEEGYNKLVLLEGVYRTADNHTIFIPDDFTLDINGATFKLNQFIGNSTMMININNVTDSHVINGIIEGDLLTHDYANSDKNSEWVCGVNLSGESKYSSYENLVIKNITGYGSTTGICNSRDGKKGYTHIYPKELGTFTYGDIDRNTGEEIDGYNRTRSNFFSTYGHEEIGYASISIYLGYQGNPCGTWNMVVYFYDENKNFIKSTDIYQYRRFRVPSNAKYMRAVILNNATPTNLNIHLFRIPTHSQFKNIKHERCRCVGCAPAAMNNMLFEDCEFTGCGFSGANCALDAEDGWDMMQDVTFRRLNFHDNPGNDFLTCAGHNFILEDMIQGRVYIWERTKDFVLRNSNCSRVNLGYDSNIVRHGRYRVYNNTMISPRVDGDIIHNCNIIGGGSGIFYNCEFDKMISKGRLENCTITVKEDFIGYMTKVELNNCIIKPSDSFSGRYNLSFNGGHNKDIYTFNDCKFYGKSSLADHNCFYSGEFNNCYFEDTTILPDVRCNEDEKFIFNKCEFNSTANEIINLKPNNYTVGNYINMYFNECTFNNENAKLFIYGYAKPANGIIEFNNCNINMPNVNTFFDCYNGYLNNILDFTISFNNTNIPCEKMLADKLIPYEDKIHIIK